MRPLLAKVLALRRLNDLGEKVQDALEHGGTPLDHLNRVTGIHPVVSAADLARIPASGPLLAVSNHPYGGVDPHVLVRMLLRVRPDVKFLANRMLAAIPYLSERAFLVDVFGGRTVVASNAAALREAVAFVAAGGCLVVFPAGEVSSISWRRWRVTDRPWSKQIAKLAHLCQAPVLPLHVEGGNSVLFHLAGLIHPLLRTMLLPREYFRCEGRGIRVHVGTPIPVERLKAIGEPDELVRHLRVRTYLLASRRPQEAAGGAGEPEPVARSPQHEPAELAAEVAGLPPEALLIRKGEYEVWCTTADRIPLLMLEMGRLRELAFRAVGEGSGRSLDIDRFDRHYRQLFVWNAPRQELVGAYRMGLTDEILPQQGLDGLYTSTLFHYSPQLLRQLGPAIELGRSYVRSEYQRKPLPLLLLWRGIAEFIGRNPRYVIVFGPVSISDQYQTMSKKLMMAFLETHRALTRFTRMVRPRNPPQLGSIREWDGQHTRAVVRTVDEVDRLVQEVECGQRAVPVLLRQYLKLNAKLIAFNLDPEFGNVVDALMYADMREVHPRIQDFYLGPAKAGAFRDFHGAAGRQRGVEP